MTTAGPGTLGLTERTAKELEALAMRLGPPRAAALVEEIRRAGEEEQVAVGLLRIQEALVRAPGAEALATRLVLASESIQRLLQRRPGLLRWVHRSAPHPRAARPRRARGRAAGVPLPGGRRCARGGAPPASPLQGPARPPAGGA